MNRHRQHALTAAPLAALLALAACGTVKTPTEPDDGGGGTVAPRFSELQAQIFTPSCAKSGCHDAATASGGMILAAGASHGQIVNRRATGSPALDRIEPGDPERSYLFKKVRGDADITGGRMPLDGPPYLSAEQIDRIAAWIRAGAPND